MTQKKNNKNINKRSEDDEKEVELFLAIKEASDDLNHWDQLVGDHEISGKTISVYNGCETVWREMAHLSAKDLLPSEAELASDDYSPDISVMAYREGKTKQSPSFWASIATFTRDHLLPGNSKIRWAWYGVLGAVSLAIFMLSLTMFTSHNQLFQTHTAENREIVLEDGSHIVLGAETILFTEYSPEQRRITLQDGEAYFKVAKDASRPFIVMINGLKVKAIGTAFNIRRSPDKTTVSVIEGVVGVTEQANIDVELHSVPRRVRPENTKGPLHTTTLTVGEQISYAPGQNLFGYKIHEPAKTLSWQSDVLFFSGEKLKDIFYMLNRYTTEDIIILDPKVGDFMFSGTVNKHNIDQWFKGLSAAFPVTVTNENQRLLVALKTAPTPALKN